MFLRMCVCPWGREVCASQNAPGKRCVYPSMYLGRRMCIPIMYLGKGWTGEVCGQGVYTPLVIATAAGGMHPTGMHNC